MTVLHLISDTNRRGAQIFATDLVTKLREMGGAHEVAALAPGEGAAQLDVEILAGGVRQRRRRLTSAELVVAHGSTTLDAASTLAPRRFVYRSIGDPAFWLSSWPRRIKTGVLLSAALQVVPLYPAAADAFVRLAGVPRRKITVIPNAVSTPSTPVTEVTPKLTSCDRHVLFVGALSWEKQVDHIIEAVAPLRDTGLVIVGDGPERTTLEAHAARVLGDRVVFVGAVRDPRPYYRASDVLALTSVTEGHPGCVLEAALEGTPTCGYGVGGVSELVQDGRTGRLVNRRSDLSTAIEWAIERREELGARARDLAASGFSISRVAYQWANLLGRVSNQQA